MFVLGVFTVVVEVVVAPLGVEGEGKELVG